MPKIDRQYVIDAIAKSMRDFGYPDVTSDMILGVVVAFEAGERLPHGIVGMMAEGQIKEISDARPDLVKRP